LNRIAVTKLEGPDGTEPQLCCEKIIKICPLKQDWPPEQGIGSDQQNIQAILSYPVFLNMRKNFLRLSNVRRQIVEFFFNSPPLADHFNPIIAALFHI
jgi:hypothetical protein